MQNERSYSSIRGVNAKLTLASGSDVRSGISVPPKSKFSRRLHALRKKWRDSIWRTTASELYRFHLRIRANLNRPSPRHQMRLPLAPMVGSDSFLLNRSFALACSDHIQQQSSLYPWVGPQDIEMLGLAFRAGAEWHSGTQNNSKGTEDAHALVGADYTG
jgi:hypothetical protein